MATQGPASQSHQVTPRKTVREAIDGGASTPNVPSTTWRIPRGSLNQLGPLQPIHDEQLVDRARRIEQEEQQDGDRDGARHRREVERGPEEADELDTSIDEDGEEERDRRLDRDDKDHVVEVVANCGAEVVLVEARLGSRWR